MFRLVAIAALSIALLGCEVNSTGNIDVDGDDIRYIKDHRTNLCFAVIGSRKSFSVNTTGIGLSLVNCEQVARWLD